MNTDQSNTNGSTQFLNFSDALNHLRWGEKIARRQWRSGSYLKAAYGGRRTGIEKRDSYGDLLTRNVSGIDVMAGDWFVL